MNQVTLLQTPLHDWHARHSARLVDFAGWSMPVQYDSIISEHVATRERAGLFDVSHMGRFRFDGTQASALLDRILTRRASQLKPGQIRYGLITNETGGILDDILVYHLVDQDGHSFHALVVNAGNRDKIASWIHAQLADFPDVTFTDQTLKTAMISVQGPRAISIVTPLVDFDLPALPYYHGRVAHFTGQPAVVSRTGYTGEDGCELVVDAGIAESVWQQLMEAGVGHGLAAAGLGARDTLRLEAAMPLYGHELSESINPYQAGLGFAVQLKDRAFIGRDALAKLRTDERLPVRVGLQMDGKRVPREEYPVLAQGRSVGRVTSGTFSPTLQRPLAMAYIEPQFAASGSTIEIDLRGQPHPATIVELPFYKRRST